jgi:hypothetical protein
MEISEKDREISDFEICVIMITSWHPTNDESGFLVNCRAAHCGRLHWEPSH